MKWIIYTSSLTLFLVDYRDVRRSITHSYTNKFSFCGRGGFFSLRWCSTRPFKRCIYIYIYMSVWGCMRVVCMGLFQQKCVCICICLYFICGILNEIFLPWGVYPIQCVERDKPMCQQCSPSSSAKGNLFKFRSKKSKMCVLPRSFNSSEGVTCLNWMFI